MCLLLAASIGACSSAPTASDDVGPSLPRELTAILDALPPTPEPLRDIALIDPSGEVGPALHDALTRAQNGETARIVVLGGSHVAGDLVTGPLRRILQRHFGDAGHGFVLPLPPYDSYWQSGVFVEEGEGWAILEPSHKNRLSDHYGPLASALIPIEPAFAVVETRGADASQVELLYLEQPGGGTLSLDIDGVALTVATDGPALAAGSTYIGLPDGPHRIEVRSDGVASTRLFGMVLERARPGVVVDQMGINGITPSMLLLAEPETSTAFVRARRPDVVVLWLGGNESGEWWPIEHHEAQLRALLTRLREGVPNAACVVLGALDRRQAEGDGWVIPRSLDALFDVQRRVSIEQGCAFFDSNAWQGGPGAVERLEGYEMMRPDRVHLVQEAYEAYAGSLLRALIGAMNAGTPSRP
jgi:lysophospholipase L1-like esterase